MKLRFNPKFNDRISFRHLISFSLKLDEKVQNGRLCDDDKEVFILMQYNDKMPTFEDSAQAQSITFRRSD